MYDIPELEKKWKRYKRNKIKKPLIFTIVILILIVGIAFFAKDLLNSKKVTLATTTKTEVKKEKNKTDSLKANDSAIVITKTPIVKQSVKNEPEIDLSNATIVKPNVPDDEIRVIGFDKKEKKDIENKYKDIIKGSANATSLTNKDPIVLEYEEKFKETQDPQYSLYLAKYYYKKGDYKKAEIWAINTNDIDGEIEDSWIIFAKARAKQGHRVEAIKILQEYYDNTSSLKVKELLDKLRRNKPFK